VNRFEMRLMPGPAWRFVEWDADNHIVDVMECARYLTLRNIGRGRGAELPTEYMVSKAIAKLNLPSEALFDERNYTHVVEIKDGRIQVTEVATDSKRVWTGKVWGIPSDAVIS